MKTHKQTIFRPYIQKQILCIFLCFWNFQYNVSGEVRLGGMESWGFNGVRTGMVSLVSPNKLKIRGLDYTGEGMYVCMYLCTGEGPAVWFMVGYEDEPYNEEFAELAGTIIPDESGGCERLQRYSNENVMLRLPKGMNFTNYDYLAIYCTRFNHNFGYVQLKRDASPELMEPMDPLEKLPKPCPQDHLEDDDGAAEEEEDEEEDDNRRRKRRKSIKSLRKRRSSGNTISH